MRLPLLSTLFIGLLGLATPAHGLDLPVRDPGRDPITGPAYRNDRLVIRLAPQASRLAAIAVQSARVRATGAVTADARHAALGVAALDRVAQGLGGARFIPEFSGERPPPAGSAATDLAAYYIVDLPAGADLEDALARFAALAEVAGAEPIAVLPVSAVPNDSLWTSAWWLFQPSRRDIHAPEAWDVTKGDTSIVIAILDTGVLPYHPDLGGVVAGSGKIWTNVVERDGIAGVDDDGNGFVDDVHGWDFVDSASVTMPSSRTAPVSPGEDTHDPDNDPNDFAGHGTAVAGFAAAIVNNGIGLPGVAWDARIMPVRMAWSTVANPLGIVDMSFAAQAIHYAYVSGARVINASWASLIMNGLDVAALEALRGGVTIVSADGNNVQPHELADFDDVIAVAATTESDQLASFSNRGPLVDLSAPGIDMKSTFVEHAPGPTDSLGNRTPGYAENLGGTSFAAPLVSGTAALVQALRRAQGKKPLTATGMRLRLRETTDDISAANPTGGFGTGRLRADRALTDGPRSQALRMGSGMVGAPVLARTKSGRTRIVSAHFASQMVMLDGQEGDTVWVAATVGQPTGQVAAAEIGGGLGVAFFVGTTLGRVMAFDANGVALPGWPVTVPGPFAAPQVALGDLDGDGILEVIAATNDRVAAYRVNSAFVPGFPVVLPPPVLPVAIADLDAVPGSEVVVAAGTSLYVLDGSGQPLAGWPVALTATQPPVVGGLGSARAPTIFACSAAQMSAFAPDGTQRWPGGRALGGFASAAPALSDFDRDGGDDLLVATSAPTLAVFDSLGLAMSARNWPVALPSSVIGHPVIGSLDGTVPTSVLAFHSSGLYAWNDSARALPGYPKLGTVGAALTLDDIDADGRTEALAGTDSRALFYIHDLGASSWVPGAVWPTARGNFARTGATLDPPAPPLIDDLRPAGIGDLAAMASGDTAVMLAWTASGEDSIVGQPRSYELRVATQPIDDSNFDAAPIRRSLPANVAAGGTETFFVDSLAAGTTYWFAIEAVDHVGALGPLSNVPSLLVGAPAPPSGGIALVAKAQPSRLPVEFEWRGPGGPPPGPQRIDIYDVLGRLVRTLPLGATALSGTEPWNGRDANGDAVRAAIYFARLTSGSFHARTRVVLLP